MGRAPCCDKANVKRGPWSPEEDAKLKAYIEQHGTFGNWIALPQKIGLKRCGKSCRLRWLNYLRPNLKHGSFSEEEDNIICSLYVNIGSRWSIIAAQLPGRTDNDIKNYWNTKLKKKLLDKQRKEQQAQARRVVSLKQEIKRESENLGLPIGVIGQTYWPTEQSLPIPVANSSSIQDYNNLNNQTSSLKNLQTKLDGLQFSEENQRQAYTNIVTANMNSQYSSCDINYFPQDHQEYTSTMNMITPAGMVSSVPDGASTCCTTSIFSGFGNFPNDLSGLASVNQQQIDGSMRVFYGMESMDQSLVISDYQGTSCQQTIPPQDVSFQESKYFGMQAQ